MLWRLWVTSEQSDTKFVIWKLISFLQKHFKLSEEHVEIQWESLENYFKALLCKIHSGNRIMVGGNHDVKELQLFFKRGHWSILVKGMFQK